MLIDLKNGSRFCGIFYYMQYHRHSIIILWYLYDIEYCFIMDVFNGKRNTPKLKDSMGRKQKQDSEVRRLYFSLWVFVGYLMCM